MILSGNVQFYSIDRKEMITAHFNGAWITIKDSKGEVLFERACNPERKDWYDGLHQPIMIAVHELEECIKAAITQ